jgi:LysM repeat protein
MRIAGRGRHHLPENGSGRRRVRACGGPKCRPRLAIWPLAAYHCAREAPFGRTPAGVRRNPRPHSPEVPLKTSSLVAAALVAAAPLVAQQQAPAAGAQDRTHTVQPGETLWGISQAYLSDPFLWPEIFRLNIGTVQDPARIYPRQQLVLPPGVSAAQGGDHTVFYPTDDAAGTRQILGAESAARSAVTRGDFYRASFLAQRAEVAELGRVAENVSPTVVPIEMSPQVQPYDRVNVSLAAGAAVSVGDRMHFLRTDEKQGPLGLVYHSTGLGTVAAVQGRTATVVVTDIFERVARGDMATAAAAFTVPVGVRPGAASGPDARVVGFPESHAIYTVEEEVFLDLGRAQGIREGDEFEAYEPTAQAAWGTQPAVAVARLQVVRVTENTSTARIVAHRQPALALGLPVRRVERMP